MQSKLKPGAEGMASKKTLNLMTCSEPAIKPPVAAAAVIIAALCLFLILRFGVISRIENLKSAQRELEDMKSRLELTREQYSDFDEVALEYLKYTYEDPDGPTADRIAILGMLERQVLPVCSIRSLGISHSVSEGCDILSLTVSGPTLEETYALVGSLSEEPSVISVSISSFSDGSAEPGGATSVTMTVKLSASEGGK